MNVWSLLAPQPAIPMTAHKKKSTPPSVDAARDAILLAALPDVPFDGWTPQLLARACAKANVDEATCSDLFPNGINSLLAHFSNWADRTCEERLRKADLTSLRIRDRIALGVRTRLEILEPFKPAVSAALGHAVDPRMALQMPHTVWRTADRLWWMAGDTATDWNHYSKRALLSGVLTSTGLYWLSDTSDDHADTWDFLDRRIDNVMTLGKGIGTLKNWLGNIKHPFTPRRRADKTSSRSTS